MLFMVTTEQPALLVMPVPKIKSILSILLESSSGSFITPKLDNVLENILSPRKPYTILAIEAYI